ncbi:ABC transporter permease [Clostridium saudiense]|uniref:ABC transporter permease n=1 Tax=Clostridium saudiense TaxID=1414720 RepID=A0ABS2FC06_9CLOT|nr:ABC transporter permease [Clostridium saudiense]MBM6817836.1 ABC transporter permease [Clostridium saudiense]
MSNLFILLKNSFVNSTGINSLSKGIDNSKEKRKLLITTVTLLLIATVICFMSTSYSIALAIVLKPMGYLDLILIVAILFSCILSFIMSIYKAQGTLFSSKDYDLLMSLPIKNSTILTSKILSLMSISYIETALIIIPASILYLIYNGSLSWIFFIILVVGLIFIPMIPIIAASIIAMIITFISSRFKHKNIATIVVGMGALLLILIVSMNMQNYINAFVENSDSIVSGLSKIYLPAMYLKDALVNYDVFNLLKFIAISIIPFVIFIIVFSKAFKTVNGKLSESYKKANYKVKKLETSSITKALVMQELRRYFATPIYVMNTAFGMVLLVAASIATLFVSKETLVELLGYPEIANMIPVAILVILVFTIGLSCTTNSSISLEGNRLWILKVLPIEPKDIFKGKIITNLIITIPAAVIANIIFYIGLKFDVKYLILNLVISIVFSIVSAVLGLIINLCFPKMDWTNPTTVVKQSASVMITILGIMILILALIGVSIALVKIFSVTNMMIILIVVLILFLITLFVSIKVLDNIGSKKFNRL